MSGIGWQDVVVALLVLCALGYLVRRKLRARKNETPCGDCPGCATAQPDQHSYISGVPQDAKTLPTISVPQSRP